MSKRCRLKSIGTGLWALLCVHLAYAELNTSTQGNAKHGDGPKVVYVDGLAVDMLSVPGKEDELLNGGFDVEVPRFNDVAPSGFILQNAQYMRLGEVSLGAGYLARDKASDESREAMRNFLKKENWEGAFNLLDDILISNPGDTNLLRQAAVLGSLAKNYDSASRYFAQYIQQKPYDSDHLAAWSSVLLYQGKLDQARRVARRALEADDSNLYGQLILLFIKLKQDEPLTDEERFDWKSKPLNDQALLAGWLVTDGDRLIDAVGDSNFSTVCDVTLGLGTRANLLLIPDTLSSGLNAVRSEAWVRALVYFDLGKEYGLDGVEFVQIMARCYFETGNRLDALKIMHGLISQWPKNAMLWYNYGYVLINFGIYDEASTAFKQSITLDGDDPEVYFALACAYIGLDQSDLAWTILGRLTEMHPEKFKTWAAGDKEYLVELRADARYKAIF